MQMSWLIQGPIDTLCEEFRVSTRTGIPEFWPDSDKFALLARIGPEMTHLDNIARKKERFLSLFIDITAKSYPPPLVSPVHILKNDINHLCLPYDILR